MFMSLEHDYIGLSSSELLHSMDKKNNNANSNGLSLKATELRLGLPGTESPVRDGNDPLLSPKSYFVSGSKRGFSDAIDGGSGKWVFSGSAGSESVGLFSPRCGKVVSGSDSVLDGPALKVSVSVVPQSPKPGAVVQEKKSQESGASTHGAAAPASMSQVVGWPPIRSFRKNTMATHPLRNDDDLEAKSGSGCLYVKVSMDGAPYLRKVAIKTYGSYMELSSALEKKFSCFTIGQCSSHGSPTPDGLSESRLIDLLHGSEYVLTYEDKDGDWMLVGDVPWEMFTESCRRLRIMRSSEAIGLAPRAMEKCKSYD
ncbi:AUX_IAA domain-containing protein [Cephalotus follicularis]|uniref:Auxin-responsive protein n=1 Tax=Cephalotus follicularis TaxID=3775 RepID=A0A1Q3DFB9_CEPFO|nr:AUX_IAA domain-containing protein [Cephalotus follicularis]